MPQLLPRGISCVCTHGMQRAGARHANGAVMATITATPPASCTACLYSPTTTTLGKKNLPHPLIQRSFTEQKAQNSPNFGVYAGNFVCVHTRHAARGRSACKRRGDGHHHRHAARDTTFSPPAYYHPANINTRPPPYLALLYRAKMPKFPKIWGFARGIISTGGAVARRQGTPFLGQRWEQEHVRSTAA